MTDVTPMARTRPIEQGSERAMLESMLDFYRATVVNKVAGLTDAQAFTAAVPPSTLTPATVVKHLAGTERFWFSIDFAALDVPWPWPDDAVHGNFRIEPGDTLAAIVAEYVEECARSRRAVVDADLDDPARGEDMDFTLRFAMLHMVEETARHCGHLDLLREVTDGVVGMQVDEEPPVGAFWSTTLYDIPRYYLVDNPINRYSVGDRTAGIRYGDDGSLTITVSHTEPPLDERPSWLPAPATRFRLLMRLYTPGEAVLDGTYPFPRITVV